MDQVDAHQDIHTINQGGAHQDIHTINQGGAHQVIVAPRYNDHHSNRNFDFQRNFFGNVSFLIKIYYIIMEFTLSNTDGDSWHEMHFCTQFLCI